VEETRAEKIARLRSNIRSLDNAIATGVRSAFSDGERIEYQSMTEMRAARDAFKAELSGLINANRSRWGSTYVYPTMRWS